MQWVFVVFKLEYIMFFFFRVLFCHATNRRIVAPDLCRIGCDGHTAESEHQRQHLRQICSVYVPPRSSYACFSVSPITESSMAIIETWGTTNSWWQYLWFLGYEVCFWCDTWYTPLPWIVLHLTRVGMGPGVLNTLFQLCGVWVACQ